MIFTDYEKKLLIELICQKQMRMLKKDMTYYTSKKYGALENLKVAIRGLPTIDEEGE